MHTTLLTTDLPGSVLKYPTQRHALAYSPFGGLRRQTGAAMAYHSQWLEDDYYVLGNGYRVYAPRLMRFHSPDACSPFGKGGLNTYSYCLAEPINHSDSNAHNPFKFLKALKFWSKKSAKSYRKLSGTSDSEMLSQGIVNKALDTSTDSLTGVGLPPPRPPKPRHQLPTRPAKAASTALPKSLKIIERGNNVYYATGTQLYERSETGALQKVSLQTGKAAIRRAPVPKEPDHINMRWLNGEPEYQDPDGIWRSLP